MPPHAPFRRRTWQISRYTCLSLFTLLHAYALAALHITYLVLLFLFVVGLILSPALVYGPQLTSIHCVKSFIIIYFYSPCAFEFVDLIVRYFFLQPYIYNSKENRIYVCFLCVRICNIIQSCFAAFAFEYFFCIPTKIGRF